MKHSLCDACETVSHCMRNGCIPITRDDGRQRPIDWPAIVRDLERSNLTMRGIGKMIGTDHSTVVKWKNDGKEPLHSTGERLVTLWCAVTGRDRKTVHLVPPFTSNPGKLDAHAEAQDTSCASSREGDETGTAIGIHA